ncbi:MAG: DUF1704 domain-containing protein [Candidatus Omnitrophica bacterium]|nr:DUF1704 domain-containing protein [Candidatus Omnitrophota bacterium]
MIRADLKRIDAAISELAREIDFYPLLTPVNRLEEQEKFFLNLAREKEYNPRFIYKKKDFTGEKDTLRRMRDSLREEDLLEGIFRRKIDFMLTEQELLDCGDWSFGEVAKKLHGTPEEGCIEKAAAILENSLQSDYAFPEESVTPEEMAGELSEYMRGKGLEWKVRITDKIIPKITVSGKDRTLYINSRIRYTRAEVQRLKVHEIEVHVYRGANGAVQPYRIFTEGLAGYNETEEGLAVMMEDVSGCLEVDTRQMKLYAGRSLSTHLCMRGSFYEAYRGLERYFPGYMAYRLVERAKRGISDTSLKGCLTKGSHYISGWIKLRKYVEQHKDLSIIYVGKVRMEDAGSLEELLRENLLKPAQYFPDFRCG